MTENEKPVSAAWKAVSLLLALLPAARMARIVFNYGENNLSNDYIARTQLVGSMLDGTCDLGKFVREAWIWGGHSTLAVIPIYYLNARFFDWSVWFELGLGLALVAATLVLLAGAIPGSARWPLLPLLSLLLFSTSRVSVFTFGEPALQYGLSQLGVAIGAFALARRPGRPVALALALAFGGILASWSWGGGIMVWPLFLAALVLRRVHGIAAWAVLAGGAVAGLAQYAWRAPLEMQRGAIGPVSWGTKWRLTLDLLGRSFVNGIAHFEPNLRSQAIGAGGLLILAAILILLRTKLREMSAPLLLVAWALLVTLEISLVRSDVTAWYVSPMAFFWAGLLMLLATVPAPFRAGGILVVALLALRVQGTWEDKSFYLPSRAPASAACLREWRTAPPACHARVFQWGDEGRSGELAVLGEPLERHRLSIFGSRRTYLLQGDVAAGRVRLDPASAPSFFSRDGKTPGNLDDFHRLDLVLSSGTTVTWRVDVPPATRRALFTTVVSASTGDSDEARGARVSVAPEGGPAVAEERVLLSVGAARALAVDLSPFAGKSISLRLLDEETNGVKTALLFEAPRIELELERAK